MKKIKTKDIENLTNKRLRKLISKTEKTLGELEIELVRREQESQNHEIDDLEHHMESAEGNLTSILNFLAAISKKDKN